MENNNQKQKVALVTGISGQDGSWIAELLLEKNYIVHGIIRRSSHRNTQNIDHLYKDRHEKGVNFFLHYGDLSDSSSLDRIIKETNPDEVYNLAAMSMVKISFDIPEYTSDIDGTGTLRILESIRKHNPKIKFYQAGTSELYGGIYNEAQDENTPFYPRSPYACAKLYSNWITTNYREAYGMFAVNGILFNHTSHRRGHNFVEQKIVKGAVAIKKGKQNCLYLGNIYSERDIGHSKDYVRGMWLMLQQDKPDNYVLATGEKHQIKEIVNIAFEKLEMPLEWSGEGENEIAKIKGAEQIVVKIDPKYYRPTEVDSLLGNPSKAIKELGWTFEYTFDMIINEMIEHEMMK